MTARLAKDLAKRAGKQGIYCMFMFWVGKESKDLKKGLFGLLWKNEPGYKPAPESIKEINSSNQKI